MDEKGISITFLSRYQFIIIKKCIQKDVILTDEGEVRFEITGV